MINDLNEYQSEKIINLTYDVCIVGGGTAGIYLAHSLSSSNLNLGLFEAGGEGPVKVSSIIPGPNLSKTPYRGSSQGRMSGLGGTSVKWGGQMIPLASKDFQAFDKNNNREYWPINYEILDRYYKIVSDTFNLSYGLQKNSVEFDNIVSLSKDSHFSTLFELRQSVWIPFRKRNFHKAFQKFLKRSKQVNVWINSVFDGMNTAVWDGDDLKTLLFRGSQNQLLKVSSKIFVFTMGAIETTKHLLTVKNIKEQSTEQKMPFCDHVSLCIGSLDLNQPFKFSSYFSPYFKNGTMRTFRFELSQAAQDKFKCQSAFVHFVEDRQPWSAIEVVRAMLRKLQGEEINIPVQKLKFSLILKEFFNLMHWRILKRKLFLNHYNKILIMVDIEQRPNNDNEIIVKLGGEVDIRWDVDVVDKKFLRRVAEEFKASWEQSLELAALGSVTLLPENMIKETNYYDVFHPTGSIPVGFSDKTSVLDGDLKVWNTRNLYASSTAMFPTAGSANPGFTHLALTERLSQHIQARLGANQVRPNAHD